MKATWLGTTGIVVALSCAGCHVEPLKSELVGFPAAVAKGEPVRFKVRLWNRSPEPQLLPDESEVQYGTGFTFIPGIKPSAYRPDEGPINRISIDVCPPAFEKIAPKGVRDYDFQWTPPKNVHGAGTFVIELPKRLPLVKPQSLRIE